MKLSPRVIFTGFYGAVLLVVSGCAPKEVSIKEKTNSNQYDGYWVGRIQGTAPIQPSLEGEFGCNPVVATIASEIRNGEINGRIVESEGIQFKSYVNEEGFFRALIPTEWEYDVYYSFSQAKITLIIEGELTKNEINGKFIFGDESGGYSGCKTDIRFIRSEEPYKEETFGVDQVAMRL